jgi:hypothetical protein
MCPSHVLFYPATRTQPELLLLSSKKKVTQVHLVMAHARFEREPPAGLINECLQSVGVQNKRPPGYPLILVNIIIAGSHAP